MEKLQNFLVTVAVIKWCVCSGPDRSHFIDVVWFDRLKDAKRHASGLAKTPSGRSKRPYKIERHEFKGKGYELY